MNKKTDKTDLMDKTDMSENMVKKRENNSEKKKDIIIMVVISLIVLLQIVFQVLKAVGVVSEPALLKTKVKEIDMFGDAVLNVKEIDLEYGDSVDISFSGGYEIKNIPYYPAFYGRKGDTVISDYFDYIVVANVGGAFINKSDVKPGEKVTIKLNERKRFIEEYKAYDVDQDKEKWEGQTDEEFINAREVDEGTVVAGIIHRGSSPTNPDFNRMELMDEYIQHHGINCIINLSESMDTIKSVKNLPAHTKEMLDNGQIIAVGMGVDFQDEDTKKALGKALVEMTERKGPYLIHCSYGKDRTGVVIAILQALCGATYQEIEDDYMLSYKNLHNINMNPDSDQYQLNVQRLEDELADIFEVQPTETPYIDMQAGARKYLLSCGMTDEQIDKLKSILEGK